MCYNVTCSVAVSPLVSSVLAVTPRVAVLQDRGPFFVAEHNAKPEGE